MINYFVPPPNIQRFQQLHGQPFADIPNEEVAEVRRKMDTMHSGEPEISVVIIAYNEEEYIFGCLASLAETQSSRPIEIVVVDNNSTDRTAEIVEACGARLIPETRQGYGFARQGGLEAARGNIVLTGDADTLYPPRWAEEMAKPFDDPTVSCTYSLHALLPESGNSKLSLFLYQFSKTAVVYLKDRKRPQLSVGGASMGYRRKDVMDIGGYRVKDGRWEDGGIALQLTERGSIEMVAGRKAMIYTSMRRSMNDGTLWQAFVKRLKYRIRHLDSFFFKQKDKIEDL